jgi:hypothetical protein
MRKRVQPACCMRTVVIAGPDSRLDLLRGLTVCKRVIPTRQYQAQPVAVLRLQLVSTALLCLRRREYGLLRESSPRKPRPTRVRKCALLTPAWSCPPEAFNHSCGAASCRLGQNGSIDLILNRRNRKATAFLRRWQPLPTRKRGRAKMGTARKWGWARPSSLLFGTSCRSSGISHANARAVGRCRAWRGVRRAR